MRSLLLSIIILALAPDAPAQGVAVLGTAGSGTVSTPVDPDPDPDPPPTPLAVSATTAFSVLDARDLGGTDPTPITGWGAGARLTEWTSSGSGEVLGYPYRGAKVYASYDPDAGVGFTSAAGFFDAAIFRRLGEFGYLDLGDNGGSSNAYLSRADDDAVDGLIAAADAEFSIAALVRLPDASGTALRLLSALGSPNQFQLFVNAGKVAVGFYPSSASRVVTTDAAHVTDDEWVKILVNYDGSVDTGDGLGRVSIYTGAPGSPLTLRASSLTTTTGSLGDIPTGSNALRLDSTSTNAPNADYLEMWISPGLVTGDDLTALGLAIDTRAADATPLAIEDFMDAGGPVELAATGAKPDTWGEAIVASGGALDGPTSVDLTRSEPVIDATAGTAIIDLDGIPVKSYLSVVAPAPGQH